jgi:ribosomal protein S18 acetylase RimI-like enzyme
MADPGAAGFSIREIRADEYDALGELTVRAYAASPSEADAGYQGELRDVARRARLVPVLVAVALDGRVLGGVAYVSGPDTPYSERQGPDEAGFRMLAVDPAEGGRGLGRALAKACIARARASGRGGVAIYSRPSRTVAHRLYRSLGFRRDEARDWEVQQGDWLWSFTLRFEDPA